MMSERFTAWTLSLAQRDGVLATLFVLAACLVFAFVPVYAQLNAIWRVRALQIVIVLTFIAFYGSMIALVQR